MTTPTDFAEAVSRRKGMMDAIRERAQKQFESDTPGIQIATSISNGFDEVLRSFVDEILVDENQASLVAKQGAVVAIGGTGRGDPAPYSDIDLLFLHERTGSNQFQDFAAQYVQNCWDTRIELGHSTRDVGTCLTLARQDPQIATPLIEARLLWGNERLFKQLTTRFRRRVVDVRRGQFIEDCLNARFEDWDENGPPAQELEPDIKASSGGLRDLHLIRWIGFARYGACDIDSLRLKGAITKTDAKKLKDAWEFLTRLRIDLHLHSKREQDRLTKDEQLRIAKNRGIEGTAEQRPVERFMQQYFEHSSELSTITRRFAAIERPRSVVSQARDIFISHRAEGVFLVTSDRIDVATRNLSSVCKNLESILRLYKTAALYNVKIAPQVTEAIKARVLELDNTLSPKAAQLFMDIFKFPEALGKLIRNMFTTGVLDLVIPDVTHVRNLLQFNQYHHFTVDEHTLRAVETVTGFANDEGPVGTAYAAIKNKEVLHLAMLLHDLGKGMGGDHSEIGFDIAQRVGERLHLSKDQTEQAALLVLRHLVMADFAFRRDISDIKQLVDFSRDIGSPETMRMLYVLTVADVTAVGPGTWTDWKANLLTELFDRCLVILTGKRYSYHEQERMSEVKNLVLKHLQREQSDLKEDWVKVQLEGFSAYHLTCVTPEQVAIDLKTIHGLDDDTIEVIATWLPDTCTTQYRVITRNPIAMSGCFYKMAGVLTAKRLEILSADITTTSDGVIIDSYLVGDDAYAGEPPRHRIEEVATALRSVLKGKTTIEELFQRHTRYGETQKNGAVEELPRRIKVDNVSSDSRTIIEVFAYDRPGLLYTVTRTLFELNLSIDLAKIATHLDQVIDVFYVQEQDGSKVASTERIAEIKTTLETALDTFFDGEHEEFE